MRRTYDSSNRLVVRFNVVAGSVTFRDGASLRVIRNMMYERLDEPFEIQGQTVPVGDYDFSDFNFRFESSRARRVNASAGYRVGEYFDGHKKEISASVGLRYSAALQASVNWGRNIVDLASGGFITDLVGVRADAAFSPKMFLQAFVQYNTAVDEISTNVRYRFIHNPLSDFFITYTEVRPSEGDAETVRVVSMKMTHLLNF